MRAPALAAALALGLGIAGAAPSPAAAAPVGEAAAIRVAEHDPKVAQERREHPELLASARRAAGNWQVGYFAGGREVAVVVVDGETGEVRESWTGYQVLWKMARGYSGAFGRSLNAPYVFLPLCALFLLGLADWRSPRRMVNADLLALLAFGVSHYFFNRAQIGVSVPLQYLPLAYLLLRALWIGVRGGGALRPRWPASWLLLAALFLMGFRVGLDVADSSVIDVGYAGVVGGDHVLHGRPLYGSFPEQISRGDTYGPAAYYAYVPADLVWPWSGSWDDLPAAHATAVLFDVATFALLILLALRIRPGPPGRRLAATLAFGWAAYPYTAFALESNSNDMIVAFFLVLTLLAVSRPLLRGASLAAATLTKFAPIILLPMLATYEPSHRQDPRVGRLWVMFGASFVGVSALLLAWPAIDPGLSTVWQRTIGYQAGRESPFSIWGQVGGLEWLRIALLGATGALALLLALRPRRKTLGQVAALAAALLIAVQITMQHWFYLYIVWFYPLLLVGLAVGAPDRRPLRERSPAPSPARTSRPAPAR
jgi:hypothetical protein